MTETKLSANLPTLDVEIVHRQFPEDEAEAMTIKLKATPSFEAAAGRLLPPLLSAQLASFPVVQPMMLWARWMETMWSPWLRMAGLPLSIQTDAGHRDHLPEKK